MRLLPLLTLAIAGSFASAQDPDQVAANARTADPATAARFAPAYPVPYAPATDVQIKADLDRVLTYVEGASRVTVVDRATDQPVTDSSQLPARAGLQRTDFLLTSYEWGVTYAGMLHVAGTTGDERYLRYVADRLLPIARLAAHLDRQPAEPAGLTPRQRMQALLQVRDPRSLDDSGAMAAAMIKASRAGIGAEQLRPWIDRYLTWISRRQDRLPDGTLARQRPHPSTLWLDDLYMSVPALAQMGALTGDRSYWDDAVKQVLQFSSRMFVPARGLYRHGWVQDMEPHPAFHWARANGWAIVAMTELLEVLPADHPGREAVLAQYQAHVAGLAAVQSGQGLWHQLLDRSDSYLETSASAMFVYSIARGINRGWLNAAAYGPVASLGWNAVATKINPQGQVEGTCIGTGMGFDPMFYYYRPTSPLAAHGYGPVLLAGAEMIQLHNRRARGVLHDGGVHFTPSGYQIPAR
jgi:rhamnogalacturonyl hydrolase YesR